jgi:hypothetical protein
MLGCRKAWRVHLYNTRSAKVLLIFSQAQAEDTFTFQTFDYQLCLPHVLSKSNHTSNSNMCLLLALGSAMKKKSGQNEEANTRVVPAQRSESPSSRLPPQVSQVPSHGGNQNGKHGGRQ